EGAADWAVYYPPILLGAGVGDPLVQRAAALLDAGDPRGAETLLNGYSGPDRAAARALQSLAAIFRNDTARGLTLAREAVEAGGSAGAAQVALSYALQAAGRIGEARDAAAAATAQDQGNAYAWARLAELELTLGNRRAGVMAAERSLSLAETALAHAVLGFSRLATGDAEGARGSFDRSIALDDDAPLPRLGLGLALLNAGETAAGRLEIETAAALDPQRAQLRGWLGRAYLEEGLSDKALAQFRLAQEQDPDDPTSWLFEAEERYAANQPVAALQALQEAQDRSDGRATVRGRAGLGDDEAAQASAAGRIFDTLGFEDQAIQAGARAVAADPTNAGAHRLLADLYRSRPGNEIAQASERLMAQLLSGPTNDPIQPQLGEVGLSLLDVSGPSRVTFHEFNPLIQGDGFRAQASGQLGTQGTWSDEISLTLKDGSYSVGAGQFHFQTEGFAVNNGIEHDIVSFEIRGEPYAGVSLFAEIKGRETVNGVREIAFSSVIDESLRQEQTRLSARLGAHLELTEDVDLLMVGTVADFDNFQTSSVIFPGGGGFSTDTDDTGSNGADFQAQLIARFSDVTLRAGGTVTTLNTSGTFDLEFGFPSFGFPCFPGTIAVGTNCVGVTSERIEEFDRYYAGYLYASAAPIDGVELTLGAALERVENEFFDQTEINPKAAIVLEPIDGFVLRAVYARTLKRPFILEQTLEPTTLGGFNQLFDDDDGTAAEMVGAGIDVNPLENLWLGAEGTYRKLERRSRVFNSSQTVDVETEEVRVRGYANVTFGDGFALAAGAEFTQVDTEITQRVNTLRTVRVPVELSYFDANGFFGSLRGSYIFQRVSDPNFGGALSANDEGFLVDATLGYRLPNKRGLITLEVQNALDENIQFQDEFTFTDRAVTPTLARDRVIMGRFSVVLD
ncbi:MAG: TonB-dependent receptor, partial [Pseudomonadota bacterium]